MQPPGEKHTKLAVIGLSVLGLAQMALHPMKTYRLVVHNVGWYDN